MGRFGASLGILLLGILVLSPVISMFGLDLGSGHSHLGVPVTYSLCASMGLTLLYCAMKG